MPGTDTFTTARPSVGLEASELALLRSAPDFDAEEMATVRPPGGWPTPAPPPAAGFKPAAPVWSPPNRVEPPTAWTPSGQAAEPPPTPATAADRRQPEETPAVDPAPSSPAPWRPPNRIEPPGGIAASARAVSNADASRHRFPEERTVALMAEDLLGRPLDELPAAAAPGVTPTGAGTRLLSPPAEPSVNVSPGRAEAPPQDRPEVRRTAPDANVWDQAMPLVSEG